ncbi:MAG: hypothetical protein FWD31_09435 [Planctomycetaceae bacterium]|nr:hypothetical protein [Planctomycetaceae bacterium]
MQKSLKAFLKRCDTSEPEFIGYYSHGIDLDMGERFGYLLPQEPVEDLLCQECYGRGESLLTDYIHPDGSEGFAIYCAFCGLVPIKNSDLKQWRVHAESFAKSFIHAMKIQGQISTIIPDQLWYLGRRGNRQYVFARSLGMQMQEGLMAALSKYPKATIVTASESLMSHLQKTLPNPCIALACVASLNEDGSLSLDESLLEEQSPESTQKPRKRRGERAAKIELLEQAMKDHVIAAYDYMQDTASRGEIKLLPRPSQELLAKMTQMQQPDVSRCMNDPEGKILRLIWEKSQTLDGIHELARMFARK